MRIVDTTTGKRNANPIFRVRNCNEPQWRRYDHGSSTYHARTRWRIQDSIRSQRLSISQTDQRSIATGSRYRNTGHVCQLGSMAKETKQYWKKPANSPISIASDLRQLRTQCAQLRFRHVRSVWPTGRYHLRTSCNERLGHLVGRSDQYTQPPTPSPRNAGTNTEPFLQEEVSPNKRRNQNIAAEPIRRLRHQPIVNDNYFINDGV